MFLLRRKRRRKDKGEFNVYYLITAICLSVGIVAGYLNSGAESEYLIPENSDSLYLFKYSLIKNTVLLVLIFINGFSMLGFPLTAVSLVIGGYFIAVSTSTLYVNCKADKLAFMLNNFPQTVMVITAFFLLSESVFRFSHYIFAVVFKKGFKNSFSAESKRLISRFVLSLLISGLASAYEAFIL